MDHQNDDDYENALRENQGKKGRNSYYYAHSKVMTGPEWDGKEEPRCLSVESTLPASDQVAEKVVLAEPITNYAWSDEGMKVKFYITDLKGIGEHPKEDVQFTWDATSFTLTIMNFEEKNHKLTFKRLFAEIENATVKQKPNKIIITLFKLEDVDWPCVNQGTEQNK